MSERNTKMKYDKVDQQYGLMLGKSKLVLIKTNLLGGQVDRDMRALLHADERISTTMAAVLVAITNADAAKKAEGAADNLRSQMKGYLDDNARARQELENARRETERLRREIDDLRRGRSQPHE